jgi:hypothetical protein
MKNKLTVAASIMLPASLFMSNAAADFSLGGAVAVLTHRLTRFLISQVKK